MANNYKVKIVDLQNKYKFKIFAISSNTVMKNEIDALYQAWPKESGTGTDASLTGVITAPMNIDLKGNTTQASDPTPSSPVDVNVVSGNNTINICGKNLFDKSTITTSSYLKEDGTLLTGTGAEYNTSDFIPIHPNTAYYKTQTLSPRTKYYDSNKQPLNTTTYQDISIGGNAGTFTTPNNAYYLRFTFNTNASTGIDINSLMLHKGSTATDYEAYQGASYPINLGTLELCKIGDYQDYIYKENDKWYKYGAIKKYKLDSTKTWSYNAVTQGSLFRSNNSITDEVVDASFVPLSNYFKGISNNDYQNRTNGDFYLNVTYKYVDIIDNRYTSADDFKTWLSNNNVFVYYPVATSTTTQITDATLISQLEALKGAVSYAGQTNISQVNDDEAFIISASALKDLSDL